MVPGPRPPRRVRDRDPDGPPADIPETVWAECADDVERRLTENLSPAVLDPGSTSPLGVGVVGGAVLGEAGRAITDAVAPDAATADAWRWNHAMRLCLEDRGLRLP